MWKEDVVAWIEVGLHSCYFAREIEENREHLSQDGRFSSRDAGPPE
jgi:hypothetical protein